MKSLPACLLFLCCPVLAQVTIKNPEHLEVPEPQAQMLFQTTCQVVAQENHTAISGCDYGLVDAMVQPPARPAVRKASKPALPPVLSRSNNPFRLRMLGPRN